MFIIYSEDVQDLARQCKTLVIDASGRELEYIKLNKIKYNPNICNHYENMYLQLSKSEKYNPKVQLILVVLGQIRDGVK
jgi:hypothetical protein